MVQSRSETFMSHKKKRFAINIDKTNVTYETLIEPEHDQTNKMACALSEGTDQPGHPPSLIRDFTVRFEESLEP